jgi:ribosomal protein S19
MRQKLEKNLQERKKMAPKLEKMARKSAKNGAKNKQEMARILTNYVGKIFLCGFCSNDFAGTFFLKLEFLQLLLKQLPENVR